MGEFCKSAAIVVGLAFVVVGIAIWCFMYAPSAIYNKNFVTTKCYFARGRIIEKPCSHIHGICWESQSAIEAIPPSVIQYTFQGVYTDKQAANKSLDYPVGQFLGECYYSNDYGIQFELQDVLSPLIIGSVFVGFSLFVFLVGGVVELCRLRRNHIRPLPSAPPPPYIPTENDPLFRKHPYVLKAMNEMKEEV